MHNLFADWYRQVDLNASAEQLNTRWKCVEAAVKKLDADTVLQLTRVSFALPKPAGASDADGAVVASTFKEADLSFPMKGNAQLLRVLYGVTLAQAIQEMHPSATFAALAVTCAQCSGLVLAPPVEELPEIAETYLATQGRSRRRSAIEDPVVTPKFGKSVVAQPGAVELQDITQNQWPQVNQNFQHLKTWIVQVNSALEALEAGNSQTRTATAAAFKANADREGLANRISVLKEECNVLWWLFGEYSDTAKKSWSEATAGNFCIVLGRELADQMAFYEPTSNAASFLSKALSRSSIGTKPLTALHVLDSESTPWHSASALELRDLVRRSVGVTPLHTGLVERVDASGRWIERLTEATALRPEHQLTPVQWALQAYREALLLACLENERG